MVIVVARMRIAYPKASQTVCVYSEILASPLGRLELRHRISTLVAQEKGDWFSISAIDNGSGPLFVDIELVDNGAPIPTSTITEHLRALGTTATGDFEHTEPFPSLRLLYVPPSEIRDGKYYQEVLAKAHLASSADVSTFSEEAVQSEGGAGAALSGFLIGLSVSLTWDVIKGCVRLIRKSVAPAAAIEVQVLPMDHKPLISFASRMLRMPVGLITVRRFKRLSLNRYALDLRAGMKDVHIICRRNGRVVQFRAE